MLPGWNDDVEKRTGRPDPKARVIVEAEVVTNADSLHRQDHWNTADSVLAFRRLEDGRLQLAPTTSNVISNATGTTDSNGLNRTSPVVGCLEWAGAQPTNMTISGITARLDPDADGVSGADVAEWVMQLYTPVRETMEGVEIAPISDPVRVTAGASASDVAFNFPAGGEPRPKAWGVPEVEAGATQTFTTPTTLVWIWGVDADGNIATNTAWIMADSATPITSGGNTLSSRVLSAGLGGRNEESPSVWRVGDAGRAPRMAVVQQTFTAGTISFTTNPLDLGAVPTGEVRFEFEEEEPTPTSIVYEVQNDAATAWVTVESGDTTDDLAGVGKRQTYAVRATLDPGSPANQTPSIVSMAVKEVSLVDFDGLAQVDVTGWQVDPQTHKGSICEASIRALQDGNRDYRDKATALVADNSVNDIAFRVWVGWKAADGKIQGRIRDIFDIDDHVGEGASRVFTCVGRNARLANVVLPVYDTAAGARARLDYENQTLKAVWDDILTNQIALNDRFIGPGVEDATTQVTKKITDSDAIAELDAIAYIAGGSVVSSQGRIKFVDLHAEGREVVKIFRREDIQPGAIGPGLRGRVPEFYVPWDYDFETREFAKEAQVISTNALTAFDPWRIDGPRTLEPETAKWIDTAALAETVGNRVVETQGTGLILWPFKSLYPTGLEPGDVVAVPTDRFAARDPNVARALKGHLYAVGRIVRVGDVMGRDLVLWVQSYADIRGASTTITRRGFLSPEVLSVEPTVDEAGVVTAVITGNRDTGGFRIATSTTAAPTLATIQAAAPVAATDHVYTTGTLATLTYGQTLYIGVLATENGTTPFGAEQSTAHRATIDKGAPDDLDDVPDGTTYARIKLTETQAGQIKKIRKPTAGVDVAGDDIIDRTNDTIDDVPDGATYSKVKATEVTTGKITKLGPNVEAESDLYIIATSSPKVGTVAAPGTVTKTLRIPAAELIASTDAQSWTIAGDAAISPRVTGSAQSFFGSIVMPPGVTVTTLAANMNRTATSDSATCTIYKSPGSGGATSTIATLTHSTTGWQTPSASVSEVVSGSNNYFFTVSLNSTTSVTDAKFSHLDITYTMPSYDKGI